MLINSNSKEKLHRNKLVCVEARFFFVSVCNCLTSFNKRAHYDAYPKCHGLTCIKRHPLITEGDHEIEVLQRALKILRQPIIDLLMYKNLLKKILTSISGDHCNMDQNFYLKDYFLNYYFRGSALSDRLIQYRLMQVRLYIYTCQPVLRKPTERTEFLIGAVKLQLSITSQMCHLDSFLLRENAKYGFVHGEVVSFDSAFEKILEIFRDLVCLAY